jgi:ribose transport system ATP-binding protein
MSINGTVHDTSSPRLSVSGVGVKFGGTVALDGVDLDVMPGEVLALVGENGAGKSTLMKVLSGAVTPITGSMTLEGNAYAPRNPQDARRSGMAMIYQELSLAPALSVTDNIFLGMEPHSGGVLRRAEMRRRAAEALDQLGQQIPVDEPVNRLSISDRQLVEIARASAVGCNVLILDEPTSSITRQDVDRLFGLIKTLKQQGKSIIYISHFIEEVQEICDRFVVLR